MNRRKRKRAGDGSVAQQDADEQGDSLCSPRSSTLAFTPRRSAAPHADSTPTPEEVDAWGRKVANLVAGVEADALRAIVDPPNSSDSITTSEQLPPPSKRQKSASASETPPFVAPGQDRMGRSRIRSYRDSLPPLLAAAVDGNIDEIRTLLDRTKADAAASEGSAKILALLDKRDRNGSTAEHWAAGGGHLDCLRLLQEYRDGNRDRGSTDTSSSASDVEGRGGSSKMRRRRDGKTPLHYAARNGRNEVIAYLLEPPACSATTAAAAAIDTPSAADVPTGDGTTPLHLACYSAHLSTVQLLIERYGADPALSNEWHCTPAHWVAMSPNLSRNDVLAVCEYLKTKFDVPFHSRQKQGHTPAHKAAQKKNQTVLEWLAGGRTEGGKTAGLTAEEKADAGLPDSCGNRPSDVWDSVGGDADFGAWMRDTCGW